jgi:hypothetical protein
VLLKTSTPRDGDPERENRRMIRFGLKCGLRQAYDDGDMVKIVLNLEQPTA